MNTQTTTRPFALLFTVALVAAACGGGATTQATEDVSAAPTTAAPKATEGTTTTTISPPTTVLASDASTTTIATPTTIPFDQLPLMFESLGEASGDGETLAAGKYRTDTLSHDMRHVINEDVSVWQPSGAYVIGPPTFDVEENAAVFFLDASGLPLAENIGLHDPPPDQELDPILSAAYIDEFFSETPGLVLLDSGKTSDGISSWWEFTVDAAAPQSFDHCNFGTHCVNIIWVDACPCYFIAGEEWTYRLWRLTHGEGAVYAWFQAPNEMYEQWRSFGESIVEGTDVHH